MKKKGKKRNWNLCFWLGAVFYLSIGIAGMILALFPDIEPVVERESLQTKEVTVSVLDYHIGYRSANTYYIRTSEGEKYILSGSYQRKELMETVSTGKTVVVKWYRSKFPSALMAEEMFADGKQVVFYDNDRKLDGKILFLLGSLAVLMGMGCLAVVRYDQKLSGENRKGRNGKPAAKPGKRKRNT